MVVYVDNEYIYGWYYQSEYRLIGDGTKETAERIEKEREGKKMEYPVGVMTNIKKETTYYIGKGVDIEKLFRSVTLENPKYQFYKFPYSDDDGVMLIKKKNRKSWWDDVELTDDVQKMLDIAWDCGRDYVE